MNDFLFCSQNNVEKLTKALKLFRADSEHTQQEWSGPWGCLATVGPAYPGFAPVDTEDYLIVVLGGPLPRYDDLVATGKIPDDGTQWILDRWKNMKNIVWDEDLFGHFLIVCVEKQQSMITIVTDINSFVPTYITDTHNDVPLIIGSHADAIAVAAGLGNQVDLVSIADFLTYKTVTYPYTMYKGLKQLPAASTIEINRIGEINAETYWLPKEDQATITFDKAAEQLRTLISENLKRIAKSQDKIGLLMSGGEDSRVVASLLPDRSNINAFTFADSFNREASIAKAVSGRLDMEWELLTRTPTHYLDHSISSVALCESHNFFIHAHANGFIDKISKEKRIIGGLAADAFCKGARIKGFSKVGYMYRIERDCWQYSAGGSRDYSNIIPDRLMEELKLRRWNRNEYLKILRPKTWAEWHSLIPATMNTNFTNLLVNRRLFYSYEPFMDSKVVKLCSIIPQKWKINRKLYHMAMKPVLRNTWNIQHGKGIYPYFGTIINVPLIAKNNIINKAGKKLKKLNRDRTERNEGSWPIWDDVIKTQRYSYLLEKTKRQTQTLSEEQIFDDIKGLLNRYEDFGAIEKLVQLHLLIWMKSLQKSAVTLKK